MVKQLEGRQKQLERERAFQQLQRNHSREREKEETPTSETWLSGLGSETKLYLAALPSCPQTLTDEKQSDNPGESEELLETRRLLSLERQANVALRKENEQLRQELEELRHKLHSDCTTSCSTSVQHRESSNLEPGSSLGSNVPDHHSPPQPHKNPLVKNTLLTCLPPLGLPPVVHIQ